MDELTSLLNQSKSCTSCFLMSENETRNIPFITVLPKPKARFVFVGRDPSPNSARVVGERNSRSAFLNQVFNIVNKVGLSDEDFYITNLCKCHWRTSSTERSPYPGTETRKRKLDQKVASSCINQWLVKELEILNPKLVVIFGDDNYQIFWKYIIDPPEPPIYFNKAEQWEISNFPMKIKIGQLTHDFAVIRHAGNLTQLRYDKMHAAYFDHYAVVYNNLINYLNSKSKE